MSQFTFPLFTSLTILLESPLLSLPQTCCSSPPDPSPPRQPHQSCRRSGGLRAHRESGHWVHGSTSSGFQRSSGGSGPDTGWS